MKKFLSLVLALVMAMSLVTVSAGAKDFTDASKINYDEAVAVVSAAGIVDGYEDGSFNPQNTLTRGAAAKIICNMILGPTTAAALSADTAPYSDVPTNHTFAGYIAYCQQQGIISGYADGTFRPAGTLTGYAFMKMLLGALGYDANIEGYVGSNWSIAVAKRALNIGLDDDLIDTFVGTKAVNREEACLYAFNTLKATMVDYDSKTSVNVNGAEVTVGNQKAYEVANNSKTDGYIDDDNKMQFAEKYFTDLRAEDTTDDFGRPATKWKYDGDSVGTYANSADTTYVVADAEKTLGTLMTDGDYMDYSTSDILNAAVVYYNGKEIGTYKSLNASNKVAGKGDIMEAFENDDNDVDTIVVRSYTYAKIDDVDDSLSKSLQNKGASISVDLVDIDGDTIGTWYDDHDDDDKVLNGFSADEYVEDASIAIAVSAKDNKSIIDSYVLDSVSGTPTAARKVETYAYGMEKDAEGVKNGTITIDGTKYTYAAQMTGLGDGENVDFDEEYTVYLTAEGFVLAIDGTAMATLDDVYYVVGTYRETSKGAKTYYAQAVKVTDGTVTDLKLDVSNAKAGEIDVVDQETFAAVGGLYVMDEDDGKYIGVEYTGQDRYSVVVDTLYQDVTSTSTAIRFTNAKKDEQNNNIYNASNSSASKDADKVANVSRLYLDDTTFFISVEDTDADLEVKTATGLKTISKDISDLTVYAIYKDGDDDAVFVIYAAEEMKNSVNKDDVVYLTDKATVENDDGYIVDLYYMADMSLAEDVVIDSDSDKTSVDGVRVIAQGFYVYSEDDDVLKLEIDTNNRMTDAEVNDDSDGYVMGVTFNSVKNNTASSADDVFTAISFSGATVIDTRTGSEKKGDVYSGDIDSVSALAAALKKGEVTADVFVDDGKIVFVAVTAVENDDPTSTEGTGSVDTADFSEKDGKIIYTIASKDDAPTTLGMRNLVVAYVADKYGLELDSFAKTTTTAGSEATYTATFGGADVTVEVVVKA